jgi:Recombination, repair and ssDNA binding protein UvsY
MKPPVNIDALMAEWSKDTYIDSSSMEKELLKISYLHSKYLNIMSYHRHVIRKLENEYKDMKEIRRDYYLGHADLDILEKYGWDQYQGNPITMRTSQEEKLSTDPVLTKLLLKKVAHEEIVTYCETVLKSLNNRTWDLGNYVKYLQYTKG